MKRIRIAFAAVVAIFVGGVAPAIAATLDVTDYGAKADGTTDNTAAIQKAIDECSAKGGGRVLVPGGGAYMTYTLNLKNNVELHIDRGATLLGGDTQIGNDCVIGGSVWLTHSVEAGKMLLARAAVVDTPLTRDVGSPAAIDSSML